MADKLKAIHTTISALNDFLGRAVSWFVILMVTTTVLIVVLRYGFDFGRVALQEAVIYMHAMIFMVATAYTLKHDEHVRVDIFYRGMSMRNQAWVNLLGSVLLLMPTCIYIFIGSWPYVIKSWQLLEGSREAGGLPLVFLLKTLILILSLLLFLQGVALVAESLRTLILNKTKS